MDLLRLTPIAWLGTAVLLTSGCGTMGGDHTASRSTQAPYTTAASGGASTTTRGQPVEPGIPSAGTTPSHSASQSSQTSQPSSEQTSSASAQQEQNSPASQTNSQTTEGSTQDNANAAAAGPSDSTAQNPAEASGQSNNTVTAPPITCTAPDDAQAGQCFTRVVQPPEFGEQQEQILVRPAYEKISYTDPVYEDVQKQIVVRDAYTREIEVPALYDTYYEQVLEKPAGKVWKKGRGAQERVDPDTGDIYCLVDEPAKYKTVEHKELKRPAGTRTETVPAEYTTQTVHKMVTPPQEVRTQVPAEYATVATKKSVAEAGSCEMVQVLCQDNATESKIHEVEQALQDRGYQVDNDGIDDQDLAAALRQFQQDEGLPETGLMTAETLDALDVSLQPTQQPNGGGSSGQSEWPPRPDQSGSNNGADRQSSSAPDSEQPTAATNTQ